MGIGGDNTRMAADAQTVPLQDSYRRQTLRPLHGLLFILPFLLFFQVGAFYYGTNLLVQRHLHKLLGYFGATAPYLPAIVVVLVLLGLNAFQKDQKNRWSIHPQVLAGMLAESIIWMIPLIGMNHLTGRLLANQAGAASTTAAWSFLEKILQQSLLAVGAGIYEEFVFRLIFLSLIVLIFVNILELKKEPIVILGIFISAAIFSIYHFSLEQITDLANFPWNDFLFRALAGVYLAALFVYRGFGIAAGAHAFYNIYVLVAQL